MGVSEIVDELGGFATTGELRLRGATERMLTAAVRFGHVRRVRNGWYSTAKPSDPRFRAVRVGGRLTGLSAFRQWGAWVLFPPSILHVAVPYNAARLRAQGRVRIHYEHAQSSGTKTEVSALDALVRVMLDEPVDVAVPCIDWLLRTGRVDRMQIERCVLELPAQRRGIMRLVDRSSQSVLESVARVRLQTAGFWVAPQQSTGELGATDLVVEGTVALELDGREFHADSFESDRRRDLITTVEGRHVIRVSRNMVRDAWPAIEDAIRAALAARSVGNSGTLLHLRSASQRTNGWAEKRS
jgi:very-short-patch-repair endonuclease